MQERPSVHVQRISKVLDLVDKGLFRMCYRDSSTPACEALFNVIQCSKVFIRFEHSANKFSVSSFLNIKETNVHVQANLDLIPHLCRARCYFHNSI